MQLIWYAPYPTNGVISYYTVVLNSSTSRVTLNTSSSVTTLNVTGLSPCTYYTIAVSATTGCGAGCTGPLASTSTYTAANSTNRTLLFTVALITVTYSKWVLQYCDSIILLCIRIVKVLLLLWLVNHWNVHCTIRREGGVSKSLCDKISASNVRDMAQFVLSKTKPHCASRAIPVYSLQLHTGPGRCLFLPLPVLQVDPSNIPLNVIPLYVCRFNYTSHPQSSRIDQNFCTSDNQNLWKFASSRLKPCWF